MMGRAPCCEKVGLKKGRWTAEEDEKLLNYIQLHGEGSWRSLPKNAGLLRCGKSCRLRWINYLRADLKRGNISKEEEEIIIRLHASVGNRWSLIAGQLPGRTDNEIKNYWNSHLSRSIHSYRKFGDDGLSPMSTVDIINKVSEGYKRKRGKTSRSAMKKNKTMFYKKSEKEMQLRKVGEVVTQEESIPKVGEVVQDEQESSVTWESIDEVMLERLLKLGSHEEGSSSNGDHENVESFLVFGEEGGESEIDNNVVEFEKLEGMEVVGSGEEVMEEGCKVWDEGEELWKWLWSGDNGGMEISGYQDDCLESWLFSDFL